MNRILRPLFVFLCTVSALSAADTTGIKAANLQGANLDLMTNHDPASALANFELLPDYQVNLFASEPMVANPVHMHWDSRGRLWVACSWAYPQLKPGEVANDKIIILEDTDGDGAADKSTVFAEGLYVPTGLELANGGCYVGQSPDIFFLKDTDGDDVADVKQLALTGFGIEDSHHSISAWRRGPGGWIYFQEGIFLNTQVETQYGLVRNFNGGVYQFNPRTQELRVFCTGTGGNPWGHVFDQWGQSFMVNNPRIMYLSPSTGNSGRPVPAKTLISTSKQCGGDLATGSHIGDDLRGQLLSGRFKNRFVVRYEFIESGAGFSANVLPPLISSKHPNFRPVDVKTGPDGAIYVADWYNSIINHAQHDFRDPRRDHDHGRIWRVSHKTRPLIPKPTLVGSPLSELIDQLKSPEDWTRHQARKELSERDPDAVKTGLEAWVKALDPAMGNYDLCLVEAMWACQNVERISEDLLVRVLNASSGQARSAGARVLRYWHSGLSDPIGLTAKACGDEFPRTRMEAVLSAGFIPDAQAYPAALHALDQPMEPFIESAIEQTSDALLSLWRPAMETGKLHFAKSGHRDYVEGKAGVGFGKRLVDFLKDPNPSASTIQTMASQLEQVGGGAEISAVSKALASAGSPITDPAAIGLLEALKRMSTKPPKRANRSIATLTKLLPNDNEAIAIAAAENLGLWKAPRGDKALTTILKSADASPALKQAAAIAIARYGKGNLIDGLRSLASDGDLATRYAAAAGITQDDIHGGVSTVLELFAEDPQSVDPVPLLQSVLQNRVASAALSKALPKATLHPKLVARVAAYHRRSGQLPRGVAAHFQPKPETGRSLSAQLLAEDQAALTADVVKLGDAHRGEILFRGKGVACASCHAVSSAGPEIGPNLVAAGAAAGPSYMVESILKPNAAIAEYFENKMFAMNDGSVRIGVVTFRSEKDVVVRDSALGGQEVRIALNTIQREQAMPSLMPSGLADQLTSRQDFLDLSKFLSVLGTPGDFENDERPVIRKWRLLTAPAGDALPDESAAWLPAYSMVSGELPAADLALGEQVLARGFVMVQIDGALQLEINDTKGLRLWVDGEAVNDLTAPLPLTKGRRAFTFAVDQSARGTETGLRVEVKTPAGSPVKFQVEGGL